MILAGLAPTAVALAGAAGLRAAVPILFISLSYRQGWLARPPATSIQAPYAAVVASDVIFGILCVALLVEVLMDKWVQVSALLDLPLLLLRPLAATLGPFLLLGTQDPMQTVIWSLGAGALGVLPVLYLMGGTVQRSFGWRPEMLQWASLSRDFISAFTVALSLKYPLPALAVLYLVTWVAGRMTRLAQLRVEAAEEEERLRLTVRP